MEERARFDREEKKRGKKRWKKALIFIVLILCATYGISYLMYENGPQDVDSFLSSLFSGKGSGPGYPVDYPGGELKKMFSLNGTLGILNDTNLYLYNVGGKQTGNIQHKYVTPHVVSSGRYLLLFDRGSTGYSLYDKEKLVRETSADNQIYTACLNEKGSYAIACAGEYHQSEVRVYNHMGQETFVWKSAEKTVTTLSLSEDGSILLIGCLYARGGELISDVEILNTSKEEPLAEIELAGELILEVEKIGDRYYGLTDQKLFSFDSKGTVTGKVEFLEYPLCAYDFNGEYITLITGDYQHDRYYNLSTYDLSLKEMGSMVMEEQLAAVKSDSYGVYVLGSNHLKVLDKNCDLKYDVLSEDIRAIQPMGHYLYGVTGSKILQLDFN